MQECHSWCITFQKCLVVFPNKKSSQKCLWHVVEHLVLQDQLLPDKMSEVFRSMSVLTF
jgi:hypothetical protein